MICYGILLQVGKEKDEVVRYRTEMYDIEIIIKSLMGFNGMQWDNQ